MELCKSDIQNLIRLLESCAGLIDKYSQKPCELDKARQLKKYIKKLKRKLDYEKKEIPSRCSEVL